MKNYPLQIKLENKIKAVNELNKFINTIVPLYSEQLKQGFKINADNQFSKKDRNKLNAIDEKIKRSKKIRHYFDINWTLAKSIKIHFGIYYHVAECVVNYIDQTVYISDYDYQNNEFSITEFTKLKTDFTIEKINTAIETIKQYQDKIKELDNLICDIKSDLYPTINDEI